MVEMQVLYLPGVSPPDQGVYKYMRNARHAPQVDMVPGPDGTYRLISRYVMDIFHLPAKIIKKFLPSRHA